MRSEEVRCVLDSFGLDCRFDLITVRSSSADSRVRQLLIIKDWDEIQYGEIKVRLLSSLSEINHLVAVQFHPKRNFERNK